MTTEEWVLYYRRILIDAGALTACEYRHAHRYDLTLTVEDSSETEYVNIIRGRHYRVVNQSKAGPVG